MGLIKTIGIDIDDTITNGYQQDIEFGKKFCLDNNINRGFNPLASYAKDMYNLTTEESKRFMDEYFPIIVRNSQVNELAPIIIRKLIKKYIIIFVTARDDHYGEDSDLSPIYTGKMMKTDTIKWLHDNNICYDDIYFNCKDKGAACKALDIDIMIDNDPKQITSCANNGILSLILSKPYNTNIENNPYIIRCNSWNDIANYLL